MLFLALLIAALIRFATEVSMTSVIFHGLKLLFLLVVVLSAFV